MKITVLLSSFFLCIVLSAQISDKFEYLDVFNLESVSDPQISPDGEHIVYVRNFKDIMTDRSFSNLWIINFDGSGNKPLTTGNQNDFSPRWSNTGDKIVYHSNKDGSVQLYLRWPESGHEAKITNVQHSPGKVSWSYNDQYLSFTMFVPENKPSPIKLPEKPKGANWNKPPVYIDDFNYRLDGKGYYPSGKNQIFILSVDGGTPRQLTNSGYNHGNPIWSKNDEKLFFSAQLYENWEQSPRNSDIYAVSIKSGLIDTLTHRFGPDVNPVVSPNGTQLAYLGYDDEFMGYYNNAICMMNVDGTNKTTIENRVDRSFYQLYWNAKGTGFYALFNDHGRTKIASVDFNGNVNVLADNVGGLSLGRPYLEGALSVSKNAKFAYTLASAKHPAELASGSEKGTQRLTFLNDDLFNYKNLGEVEEIWYSSSADGTKIQGWIVKPPDFDPNKKYPLILEIHGGPYASYGEGFAAELQLMATAGYVVLYTNPRGSTCYGEKFANLIHHNYPGDDYFDLMAGVDALIEKGYIDEDNLFVTGGSGGGILSAWIVGKTDRFKAAVVVKPIVNWYSSLLYTDIPYFMRNYWFDDFPWNNPRPYLDRSPLSLVGNVKTPTMVMTGEEDYRTPIAESEQYYTALKFNQVETAMVRIPESSHHIADKPSNLIAKVSAILMWFDRYLDEANK